jgi:hypothetical protein
VADAVLTLQLFDHDQVSKDDDMGCVKIVLSEVVEAAVLSGAEPVARWYSVLLKDGEFAGRVKCAVQVSPLSAFQALLHASSQYGFGGALCYECYDLCVLPRVYCGPGGPPAAVTESAAVATTGPGTLAASVLVRCGDLEARVKTGPGLAEAPSVAGTADTGDGVVLPFQSMLSASVLSAYEFVVEAVVAGKGGAPWVARVPVGEAWLGEPSDAIREFGLFTKDAGVPGE